MSRGMVFWLCIAGLLAAIALGGCPSAQEPEPVIEEPPPVEEPAEAEEPAESTFEWTEAPAVADIPLGPIEGMMNGEPFEAKSVTVQKDDDGTFELTISNKAPEGDDPTEPVTEDNAWELTFTATEGESGEWTWAVSDEKDFEKEHVYYWYAQGDDKGPMSVNHPWGAALQIDEWTVEEPDPDADTFSTILGSVKGKVALVMEDDAKSWCAGEFDAVYYEW